MSVVHLPEKDFKDAAITPYFSWQSIENMAQSEFKGTPVFEQIEMVELRIAGRESCVHTARANEECERKGLHRVTWAEKYAPEYELFKNGDPQRAFGTPLETLAAFGVTPSQMSICRAQNIRTVEALLQLEGSNLKGLGMEANSLKEAARNYEADRTDKRSQQDRIAELEAQIAAMQAPKPHDLVPGGDPYAHLDDSQLKDLLAERTGARPRGNPSRDTLVNLLVETEA